MKRGILFCLFCLLVIFFASPIYAQQYLTKNTTWDGNLTASTYHNTIAFGDIDDDGDMDMIQFGCTDGDSGRCDAADETRIYVNNGTSLIRNSTWDQNLSAAGESSIAFGDIDNDGDLDLILAGGEIFPTVYINNGTTFTENSTWHNDIHIHQSSTESVNLGDIDNDGDLDLVMVDIGQVKNGTFLNNGTAFVVSPTWGQETIFDYRVSSALVDFDNDGDLDSLSIGYDYGSVYENNGNSFELSSMWGAYSEDHVSIAVGDLDNDGDMDYIQMGERDKQAWINNGTEFINNDSWNPTLGLYYGSLALGDYDNNGYLDLASIGYALGGPYNIVYNNTGTSFSWADEDNLLGIQSDSVVWVDLDNDGDLDSVSGPNVYINNITTSNTAPTPPASFSYSYSNREVSLGWFNGSDSETISTGLYYNMKLGTAANNHSIISGVYGGQGDVSGGGGISFGYFGNMMQRKNLTLKVDRLEPSTTYYWSVQTIDTGLKAGNWSDVQSFTTPADIEKPVVAINSPIANANLSSYGVSFNVSVSDNLNLSNVSLWGNWTGAWQLNETNSSGVNNTNYIFTKDLSSCGDGTYSWMIQAGDNETNVLNSSVMSFTVDGTAPSIGLEARTPSVVYTGNDSVLNATINDSGVGVSSVWISVNSSGSFVNYSVSSGTSVYSFVLLSDNYSKGTNVSWRYYANDSVGNEQEGALQNFVVANSVPVLSGVPDNSTDEDVVPVDKFYNLSLYGSDVDGDNLTYYVQSESNSSLIDCFVYNVSVSYYLNCSAPLGNASGASVIVVNVTDGINWSNDSFIVSVVAVNDVPWVSLVNVSGGSNLTNETLSGNYTFGDVESGVESSHEIKWYKNGSEVVGLANLSSVSLENTSKGDDWMFSVRVFDGDDWSTWGNSSNLTILNSVPDFSTIGNQSFVMNSNLSLNLSEYFTDIDLDNLTYSSSSVLNISVGINQTTSVVTLVPDVGWNGTRYVVFSGSDGVNVTSNNITLEVFRPVINYSGFDGDTTNFSNLTDYVEVPVVIEMLSSGKMNFSSVTLNGSSLNISEHVNISFNRIFLNSSALPELNEFATLSLYNLTYTNPRVLKDGAVCSSCVEVGYSSGVFIFNVSGFSVYSAGETPVVNDDSSGGTSGGGGSSVMVYDVSESEMKVGYTKTLASGDKINFVCANENHSLEVESIVGNLVNVTLNSEPVVFLISVGEERKFDFGNDSVLDLLVRLNSVVESRANLTIVEINELVNDGDLGDDVDDEVGDVDGDLGDDVVIGEGWGYWVWGLVIVGLICVGLVVWFIWSKIWKGRDGKK